MEFEDCLMMNGKPDMKVGDLVCYRDQAYQVGVCMTNTSVELLELSAPSQGLWVGRDEVRQASHEIRAPDGADGPLKNNCTF